MSTPAKRTATERDRATANSTGTASASSPSASSSSATSPSASTPSASRPSAGTPSASSAGPGGKQLARAVAGEIVEQRTATRASTSSSSRQKAIEQAAYYRAERRGFEPGHELEDWLAAEQELIEREGAGSVG